MNSQTQYLENYNFMNTRSRIKELNDELEKKKQ